jgi:hypothetical protein
MVETPPWRFDDDRLHDYCRVSGASNLHSVGGPLVARRVASFLLVPLDTEGGLFAIATALPPMANLGIIARRQRTRVGAARS